MKRIWRRPMGTIPAFQNHSFIQHAILFRRSFLTQTVLFLTWTNPGLPELLRFPSYERLRCSRRAGDVPHDDY